jgi:hypothetical protein
MPQQITGTIVDHAGNAWKSRSVLIESLSTPVLSGSSVVATSRQVFVTKSDGTIPLLSTEGGPIYLVPGDYKIHLGTDDEGGTFLISVIGTTGSVDWSTLIVPALTYVPNSNVYAIRARQGGVNVLDEPYQADNTGVTDCSAAIQSAASALTSGGELFFPRGTYKFAGVELLSNTKVLCSPYARFTSPTQTGVHYWFTALGSVGTHKSEISIEGAIADGGAMMTGLLSCSYVDGATVLDCRVENCGVVAATNSGAVCGAFGNCTRIRVERCEGSDGTYGAACLDSTDAVVAYCYFHDVLRDGILFYHNCHTVKAAHNTIDGYNLGGEQGRAGIHFYGGRDGTSTGNIVKNAFVGGGFADSTIGAVRFRDFRDFTSTGDVCETGHMGVLCNQVGDFPNIVTRGTIVGATISNMNYSGITIDSNCGAVSIVGGSIRRCNRLNASTISASVSLGSRGSSCVGATITDNVIWGIYVGAPKCLVSGNVVLRCGTSGSSIPAIGIQSTLAGIGMNEIDDDKNTIAGVVTSGTFADEETIQQRNDAGDVILARAIVSGAQGGATTALLVHSIVGTPEFPRVWTGGSGAVYTPSALPVAAATSTVGVRIYSGSSATVAVQSYGTAIIDPYMVNGTWLFNSGIMAKRFAGAPTSGTFDTGSMAIDSNRAIWICRTGGTPGTWEESPTISTVFPNNTTINFKSAAGVTTGVFGISSANNVSIVAPLVGGAIQAFSPASTIQLITAAGVAVKVNVNGDTELLKVPAPTNSPANSARIFVRDNGSGKMQFCAIFPSGAIQTIATEP